MKPIAATKTFLFDNNLVVLSPRNSDSSLLLLNSTASAVWQMIEQGLSIEEAAKNLHTEFSVDYAVAFADVENLVDHWLALGMLEGGDLGSQRPVSFDRKEPPGNSAVDAVNYAITDQVFQVRFHDNPSIRHVRDLFADLQTPLTNHKAIFDLRYSDSLFWLFEGNSLVEANSDFRVVHSALILRILELSYPGMQLLAIFHAAAVCEGEQAVVMPAVSGSGKTTLTAHLLHAGLKYLGDDLIPVSRAEYQVMPLPTRLSVKSGSWPLLQNLYAEITTAPVRVSSGRKIRLIQPPSGSQSNDPARITKILFPRFDNQLEYRLNRITPTESLRRLCEDRIYLGHPMEAEVVSEFLTWLERTPAYELIYNHTAQAVSAVKTLIHS